MFVSLRTALMICAALCASSVAPAQAGPSDESLPPVETASLPKVEVPNLLDDGIEPVLAQPEAQVEGGEPARQASSQSSKRRSSVPRATLPKLSRNCAHPIPAAVSSNALPSESIS